jgi:hypothetical protein
LQRASRRNFVRNWVSLSNDKSKDWPKVIFVQAFGAAGMKIQISASMLALQFELPIFQVLCGRVSVKFAEV